MRFLPEYESDQLTTPDGASLPFLKVGRGPVPIVLIPGAGDGLRTVADAWLQLTWFYRWRADTYRMLLLSRRQPIPPDYGLERHAEDMIWAVEQLGWEPAIWECNSAGGPIGQWVAVKRPDLVRGLILTSTLHRTSDDTRAVLGYWLY